MNAKNNIVKLAFASIILFSCGENKDNASSNNEGLDIDAVTSKKSNDPNAKGDNKCLLEYQNKYDALLLEDDVIAATGFSKDKMEVEYNKVLKNPEHHGFQYKFKNGRKGMVKGIDIEMELPDIVEVRSIKAISLASFNQYYRAVSDEEMNAAKQVLNDIADGRSGDAAADAALKKTEEHNVSKEQLKKSGGSIMDVMKDVSKGYRTIDGLGDAARWNLVTNELYVVQNGVQFVIFCELNNDNEKNKTVAIHLAKIILNKCE